MIPIALYEAQPPQKIPELSVKGKSLIFNKGRIFHKRGKESDVLIVTGVDFFDAEIKSLLMPTCSLTKTETTACIIAWNARILK